MNERLAWVNIQIIYKPEPNILLGLAGRPFDTVVGYSMHYLHQVVLGMTRGSFELFELLFVDPQETSEWWDELRDNEAAFASINLQMAVSRDLGRLHEQIERERRWYFTLRDGWYTEVWPGEEKRFRRFEADHWYSLERQQATREKYIYGYDIELAQKLLTITFKMQSYSEGEKMVLGERNRAIIDNVHTMDFYEFGSYVEGLGYDWGLLNEPVLEWIKDYLRRLYLEVLE